jgi:hypothetical protein
MVSVCVSAVGVEGQAGLAEELQIAIPLGHSQLHDNITCSIPRTLQARIHSSHAGHPLRLEDYPHIKQKRMGPIERAAIRR